MNLTTFISGTMIYLGGTWGGAPATHAAFAPSRPAIQSSVRIPSSGAQPLHGAAPLITYRPVAIAPLRGGKAR
jgi:hypothetical protein